MKILSALLLSGCSLIAPLELQPPEKPKHEPIAFDIGNASLNCLYQGLVLRFILVEGDTLTKAVCVDPPPQGKNS